MFSLNLVKGIDDRNGGYENTQGRVLKSIDSDGTISKKKERYTMVKPIMKDIFFLGQKSEEATRTDLQVGKDLEDTPYETEEGCLSLVGVRKTTRCQNNEVEYIDKNWNKKRIKLSGWYAQICQHELDHLEGIII